VVPNGLTTYTGQTFRLSIQRKYGDRKLHVVKLSPIDGMGGVMAI